MSDTVSHEITELLLAWRGGDGAALSGLMPITYRSLKAVAARLLRSERDGHILETTALVHEAYLRLVDLERVGWRDRAHFYAMSARIMRQILVDHARARGRIKRGADVIQVSIDEVDLRLDTPRSADLVTLDDALCDLAEIDEERARIVELRFFGGLGRNDIAEVLGLSSATVSRRWLSARAWLIHDLAEGTVGSLMTGNRSGRSSRKRSSDQRTNARTSSKRHALETRSSREQSNACSWPPAKKARYSTIRW